MIEVLKQALEALEQLDGIDTETECVTIDVGNEIASLLQAIKELESQEPVAWVAEDVCEGQYIDGRPRKIWWECNKGVGTAFYTQPPQRTWVGLTIEEIASCCRESTTTQLSFAQELEAKIKQKNHVAQEADKTTGARR